MINLSILIPFYNGENYIKKCLESIKQHPTIKIEIVAVDDGSTDQSLKVIKECALNEKRLRIYEYEGNRGVGFARNFLLEKAKGEYLYFIDGDDEIIFDNVILAYETAVKFKLDVFVGECQKVGRVNKPVKDISLANKVINGHDFYIFSSKGTFKGIGPWKNIYNRLFLINNNIPFAEGIIHNDNEYFSRVHQHSKRVMYQDLKMYKYYFRENSISTSTDNYLLKIYSRTVIVNSLLQIIKKYDEDKEYQKAICNFISFSVLTMYRTDYKKLDKKEVKKLYMSVPKEAYLYTSKSDSKIGKIAGPILYVNIYLGKFIIKILDTIKREK